MTETTDKNIWLVLRNYKRIIKLRGEQNTGLFKFSSFDNGQFYGDFNSSACD